MKRRGGSYVLGVEATDAAWSGLDPGCVERFDSAYESDDAGRLHAEARGCSKWSHVSLIPPLLFTVHHCGRPLGCPDLIALLLPNQPHDQVDEAGHEYVRK
ncbi:MAG: hypothetical protein E8D44_07085 [Nitrospira sp.]|nr:MAG: hypothetical protein E8D44_07085 [Nitrospira sp.]